MNSIEHVMEQSQHLKLLYVEDDPVVVESTLMILEEFFTNIIVAVDGVDGLEKFEENDIDLIITDISMPNMNGFEMIEKIRESDSDISITILSAYSEAEYFIRGIELGVDGYLLKPFDMEQFLAILTNVIKSIQLRQEIKKLNERMDLALEGSETSILDWDFITNDFYIASSWKEMLGFSDDELPNSLLTWKKRVHRDDRKRVFSSLKEHLTKQIQYYENRHRLQHKDGHWIWVLGRAQIVYDKEGKAVRMIGTHTDITAEKEAEVAASEQHKYLQSIIDGVNDPIMVIKEDYTIDLMNSTIRKKLKNVNIEDPEYPKCYEVSHNRSTPCDGTNHLCPLKDVIDTKEHMVVIHDHYNGKGEKRYVEISASPLFDHAHNCIGIIESGRDVTEHIEMQDALEEQKNILHHQAHHDTLTGLPNRVLFNDRLEQGIERAKRSNNCLALFFLDLDHFKVINDSLGHTVGDKVLKAVAQRFTEIIRKEDTLARLGGDEFTIIIEGLEQSQDASQLAEKILEVLKEPIIINGNTLYASSSIGISLYPEDGKSAQDLLKYADAAMYKGKSEGRNNYQFYSEEMAELAFDRVVMEASLKEALKNEDFIVNYQPQVNGENNQLIGMEALVRWQHPIMGLVSPGKFIPLAESSGLIIELDKFVMKTAMSQIAKWYEEGLNPGILALNLSHRQLHKKDFISTIENIMQETKCKAEWIELEVTEAQIMSNPEEAIIILNKIHTLGIALSIDDFGTGYSSLSYLKKLPINKLKIDRSFIQELPGDEENAVITRSVIALAQSLNLNVIAEGVETKEQKEFLLESGCEDIQGYLYGKPMPKEEMEVLLDEGLDLTTVGI